MVEPLSLNPMQASPPRPGRNVHLDAMRGLAAVSVVCTHIRQTFFVPYHQAGSGLLVKFLYIDHYLVRAAVIFFFVLSGYLVGMSVLNAIAQGRWSWREYLLNRLSRLYVVLIPALLLTAVFDWIGRINPVSRWAYFNDLSEAGFATAHFDSFRDFFGSLFFLQNIHTGWFGSNSPLWSLSCEFWYYVVFPFLALTLVRRSGWLFCLLLLAGTGWFLGSQVTALFLCWLAGVAIGLLARKRLLNSPISRRLIGGAAIMALLLAVVASGAHRLNGYAADYVITLIAMALIWVALSSAPAGRPYALLAVLLSEMSYTLYLTHLPFLLLMQRLCFRERLWPADLVHLCLALLPLVAAIFFAYGNYLLFESHTNDVRWWLKRRLEKLESHAGAGVTGGL
ncbi:O-antigen acetylase [Acidisarcina polymorpha]|uniref:O-antigen acetylase n=1 Tax=Acidisarcina polymorpha TaxID=2211140 RepID=A0A2Z5FW80_9BACT|nr:acyltransferase [Acidisarcina polymorpha]AXC11091.1 O-antigen acetylase [Acidisarcina polymorpha]